MSADTRAVREAAQKIRLLVLDVDGVLTDGGLYFDASGLAVKRFDVHDGIGIRLFKEAGFEVAVISGMNVPCVERRLESLGVTLYQGGRDNKLIYLDKIRRKLELEWDEIAYVGDDLVDLAPMSRVGLPIAVANAVPAVIQSALTVTRHTGGHGAAREVVDFLLESKGLLGNVVERWRNLV